MQVIELTSAMMKCILLILVSASIFLGRMMADPRADTVELLCTQASEQNYSTYISNFVTMMENMSNQIQTLRYAVAHSGSGPDASYGFVQCYGDLFSVDCVLCFAEIRTVTPQCFPAVGGRLFLDGCFMRADNYSFYEEYQGPEDRVLCGKNTRKDPAFQDSVTRAVTQAAENAATRRGYARAMVPAAGIKHETAYVLANCWETLSIDSCQACLLNASIAIQGCLPSSEGRALKTGCFMRYSDFDFLNEEPRSSKGTMIAVAASIAGFVVVLIMGAAVGAYLWNVRLTKKKRRGSSPGDAENSVTFLHDSSLNFKYSTLERATRSFSEENKLGQGGFGTVYKGTLADGREIAVKRLLFNNRHRVADFCNEVNIISSLEHKNLVRLLGCSCSGPESLLVYEYLPNKSLDQHIFDPIKGKMLSWPKRCNIIIGTAEGLFYLHENTNVKIIHRDIKASNILLDSRLHPKIADFGLARIFEEDRSHISTAIAGTFGYLAPEYLAHGQLSDKADVYSFGVLVLEIITGKRNNGVKAQDTLETLVTTVWGHYQNGKAEELLDSNLMPQDHDRSHFLQEVLRVMHIGLLCTQESPTLRPSMTRTLQMLKTRDADLPAPTCPPFTDEITMELNHTNENRWRSHAVAGSSMSVAMMSMSTIEPR
ncbi:Cysteine-rich receptor-like protein [Drosera capensis]